MPRELDFQEAQAKTRKKTEIRMSGKETGKAGKAGFVAIGLLKVRLSSIWHDTRLIHTLTQY